MTSYYGQQDVGIVFIKSLEDLEKDADHHDYEAPFIFANYKVIDKTCNKELKFTVSLNKAEARKQRQLAYKKHAKCEVVIEELHLIDNLVVSVRDIYTTEEYMRKIRSLHDLPHEQAIKRSQVMALKNNINLNGTVKEIITDKDIGTRNGLMRMMLIKFADSYGDTIEITLWGAMAEGITEGATIEIRKAEINTYQYSNGLQVPRYGSVKITSVPEKPVPVELPEDGLIMKFNFKSKEAFDILRNIEPEIRDEDKVYVDFIHSSITIKNPSRYDLFGMKITELGSVKKRARVKKIEKLHGVMKDNIVVVGYDPNYGTIKENFAYEVMKDDENKQISFRDKFSWKCGQCDEAYGYQSEAVNCSHKHIEFGKMIGDIVKSVEVVS